MSKFFDLLLISILALVVFLIGLPALQLPWSLVDDGESLRIVTKIFESFPNIFWLFSAEAEHGRLRTMYWLFQALEFQLFGFNVAAHHLFHIGLFAAAVILLYLLIKKLTRSSLAAFFSGVFFIFFSPHFENLYRLGPPEIWLTVLLLMIFWLLLKIHELRKNEKKKRIFLISVTSALFFAALLTKETAVILVPFTLLLGAFFFWRKKIEERNYGKVLFFQAGIFAILFVSLRIAATVAGIIGGYTTFYDFSSKQFFLALKGYFTIISQSFGLFFWILVFSFLAEFLIYFLILKKTPDKLYQRLVLLTWFVLFLAVQLPWFFVMGRYLTPAMIGLSGFLGIQLALLLNYFLKLWQKRLIKFWLYPPLIILVVVAIILFLIPNLAAIVNAYKRVVPSERQNSKVVEYLAKNTSFGSKIYFNVEPTDEYFYEMPLHFDFFYNRKDLKTELLTLEKETLLTSGDLVVSWTRTAKYNQGQLETFLGKRIQKRHQISEWTIFQVI